MCLWRWAGHCGPNEKVAGLSLILLYGIQVSRRKIYALQMDFRWANRRRHLVTVSCSGSGSVVQEGRTFST